MQAIVNKQAFHNFEILDRIEAGLSLLGHEVKAIKTGQISLKGAFVSIETTPKTQAWLKKAHISKYKFTGSLPSYDPERPRALLLGKKEINSLLGKIKEKGLTIVPLRVYTKRNLIKLEIGLARGKKMYQKKEEKKKQDVDKEIRRNLKFQ